MASSSPSALSKQVSQKNSLLNRKPPYGDAGGADGTDRPDPSCQGEPVADAQPEGDRSDAQQAGFALRGQDVVGDSVLESERRRDPHQQQAQIAQVPTPQQQDRTGNAEGQSAQRSRKGGNGG